MIQLNSGLQCTREVAGESSWPNFVPYFLSLHSLLNLQVQNRLFNSMAQTDEFYCMLYYANSKYNNCVTILLKHN